MEAAPIYRCDGKAGQPVYETGTYMNGELTEATKGQKQFLHLDHWIQIPKYREHDKHIWFVVRLRIGPVAVSLNRLIDIP